MVFTFLFSGFLNGFLPGAFDNSVYQSVSIWQGPTLTEFMILVSSVMQPAVLLFLAVLAFFIFLMKRDPVHGFIFFLSTLFGIFSALAIKEILEVARPEGIIAQDGYSFPSIHAVAAATFFLAAAIALRDNLKDGFIEDTVVILSMILLFLVGLSRLYLQVHWFSDILGGFSLGLFWVTFFIIIYHLKVKLIRNDTRRKESSGI